MTDSKYKKTGADWKKVLTPEEYQVLREKGTEAPFSGEYVQKTAEGTYHCKVCGAALFNSDDQEDANKNKRLDIFRHIQNILNGCLKESSEKQFIERT